MQEKKNLARGILVSPEDRYLIKMYPFYIESNGYPRTKIADKKIHLHKLIMPESLYVDHINGNPLDNRRENLRACDQSQNRMNAKIRSDSSTGHKGVSKNGKKYRVQIMAYGILTSHGTYDTVEEASEAYKIAADQLHREFAVHKRDC